MASMGTRQVLLFNSVYASQVKFSPFLRTSITNYSSAFTPKTKNGTVSFFIPTHLSSSRHVIIAISKASSSSSAGIPDNGEEGVTLGTLKLPSNTDITRFETLLFQWGNSLCQGANLPLPSPLKVDKIPGGARLGFTTVGDEKSEVLVYIDCLVVPAEATDGSVGPVFRAVRNGPKKDEAPPGEPRIMRSLLEALKKCVDIARL